ncbi:MAG: ABC transporter permease [Deinococcales bacterium]
MTDILEAPSEDARPRGHARGRRSWWRRLAADRTGLLGLALVVLVVLAAALAPLIAPFNPNKQFADGLSQYGMPRPPDTRYLLGTDLLGRDLLSRILFGARVSLIIGLVANGVAVAIGAAVGVVAGYFRGWLGTILMRFTDVMTAFPALVLAIALAAILRPSLWIVALVIAMVNWVYVARAIYAQVLAIREQQYIEATTALGVPTFGVLFRHILPQLSLSLLVFATLGISTSVLLEASLSYLGVGVQPPTPSWGGIINASQSYLTTAPWLVLFPGLAIILTSIGFNLFGEALRDALDVGGRR